MSVSRSLIIPSLFHLQILCSSSPFLSLPSSPSSLSTWFLNPPLCLPRTQSPCPSSSFHLTVLHSPVCQFYTCPSVFAPFQCENSRHNVLPVSHIGSLELPSGHLSVKVTGGIPPRSNLVFFLWTLQWCQIHCLSVTVFLRVTCGYFDSSETNVASLWCTHI